MSLTGKRIKNTYKDLVTINGGADNQGLTSSLQVITDGQGTQGPFSVSTSEIRIDTNKKLEVRGEFQVKLLSSINDSGVDGEIAKLGNDIYVYEQ